MSKIAIAYFSGTGNTAWMVNHLAARLTELGDEVEVVSCEKASPDDARIAAAEVLGLAFPVYGSWAPHNMREFMEQLPEGKGRPAFIVSTCAVYGGDVSWYMARWPRRRGYEPFLAATVLMPNNLIWPIPLPEQVQAILNRAEERIAELAAMIHERRPHVEGNNLLGWAVGYFQRWGLSGIERWVSRLWYADESCVRCGVCVRNCPVGNIELTDDGVRFGDHCLLCMRCFHHCPRQAIQITKLTRNTKIFRRYPGPESHRHHHATGESEERTAK